MHYDVIVIGTGAGGGTLAHRLAPTGQAGPAPRTRRLPAAGAGQLGLHRRLRQGQVPGPGVLVRPARPRVPAGGQLLRRRQHQVLRRRAVPAAPRGLRRAAPPRRHLAGLADRLRGPGAVLHRRPSTSTWCTAGTARTRPRARRARSTRIRPVQHEPRIQQLSDDLEKQGLHPFHLPIGVDLTPGRAGPGHPRQRLHPLRPGRRLPLPGARQVRRPGDLRRPGAGARQRRAGHQRPRACGWRPTRPDARSPGSSPSSGTARRSASARTSWSSPAARSTPRRCCCARPTTSTRTAWPTAPTSSAGTTCGTTTWR